MPQRPIGDALDGPAVKRGGRHRDDQHKQQHERDKGDAERDQHEEGDHRDEAAGHEHVAMGEVDHADDAVDHRVADGDEPVDRAERDAVDQLLDEIVHRRPRFMSNVFVVPGAGFGQRFKLLAAGTGSGNAAGLGKRQLSTAVRRLQRSSADARWRVFRMVPVNDRRGLHVRGQGREPPQGAIHVK